MFDRARRELIDQVPRNVEVFTPSCVDITVQLYRIGRKVIIAGVEVAVELVIVRVGDTQDPFQSVGEGLSQIGPKDMCFELRFINLGIGKDDIFQRFDGTPRRVIRWNTAINETLMIDIFIRQVEHAVRTQSETRGRVQTNPFSVIKVAVIIQAFIHGVEPESRGVAV